MLKPVHPLIDCCSISDIRAINQTKSFILADLVTYIEYPYFYSGEIQLAFQHYKVEARALLQQCFSSSFWKLKGGPWQALTLVGFSWIAIPFTLCGVPPPLRVSSSVSMLSHANVVNIPGWMLIGRTTYITSC